MVKEWLSSQDFILTSFTIMKRLTIIFYFLATSQVVFAQTPGYNWIKTANGSANEQTNDIVISKDNFVYTTGIFSSTTIQLNGQTLTNSGGNDIFLAKYDTAGNIIWAKKYGASGVDNVVAITTDSLDNIYLLGSCTGTVNFGSLVFPGGNFLLKVNGAGVETWIIEPATNVTLMDIAADPAGNIVICGYFSNAATVGPEILTATESNDGFLAKFTSSGGYSWMKQIYATKQPTNSQYSHVDDACRSVAIAPDGSIGICGSSHGPEKIIIKNSSASDTLITTEIWDPQQAWGYLGFVMKFNATGGYIWGKDNLFSINSGRYSTAGLNIASSSNSEWYIAGETMTKTTGYGNYRSRLIKYNSAGLQQWNRENTSTTLSASGFPITNAKTAYFNGNVFISEKVLAQNDANYQKTKINCVNDFGTLLWTSLPTNVYSDVYSLAAREVAYAGGILSNPVFGNLTASYTGGNDAFITKLMDFASSVLPMTFSTANPDKIICPGGSVALAPGITISGGVQPYTYNWTPPVSLNNPAILNAVANPAATINYILTVTDALGSILKDTVMVTVRPEFSKPTISFMPGNVSSFYDTLVCNSPETGLIYSWSPTNAFAIANKLPVPRSGWGTYTVTTTSVLPGCSATSNIFYHNMVKANAGNDTTVATGQAITLGGIPEYFGMPVGIVSYAWTSPTAGYFGPLVQNPHVTINPTISADYYLIIQDQSGNPKINDTVRITVCAPICPGGNTSFTSNVTGASYQWQQDTGSGFANISNNANFAGTNTLTLQLNNIPNIWYGYKYRCISNGNTSETSILTFSNSWTGSVSTQWENPANWSCGVVPDANTDIVINSGTVILNSNVTIRSLKLNPGASLTVSTGNTLTILY